MSFFKRILDQYESDSEQEIRVAFSFYRFENRSNINYFLVILLLTTIIII